MSNFPKWVDQYGTLIGNQGNAVANAIAKQGISPTSLENFQQVNTQTLATDPDVVAANAAAAGASGFDTSALAIAWSANIVVGLFKTVWAEAWDPAVGYGPTYNWDFSTGFAGLSLGGFGAFFGGCFKRAADGMGPVTNVTPYMIDFSYYAGVVGILFADHESEHLFGWMAGPSVGLDISLPAIGFLGEISS